MARIDERHKAHALMVLLVVIWGMEYICVKVAMGVFPSLTLLHIKYLLGLVEMFFIKMRLDPYHWFRKRDIIFFILCSLTGELFYYYCEYSALDHMPVSLVTILLAFVPVVSVLIERVIWKRKANARLLAAMIISIVGVVLIIGVDISQIMHGRLIGYLFCLGAIISWNCYNFLTAKLAGKYTAVTMAFCQLLCTTLLTAPYAYTHMPPLQSAMHPKIILAVLFMGIVDAGLGFIIYVYSISRLGPTTNAVYSNFLPVSSTILSFLLLGERISPWQILGGLVVIGAGYFVIREKARLDEEAERRAAADN
ncbi:MAG: DMT family transporter [Anaerovoracaceae bacterium]|jgi:drug/metabolite transporter (DMT)-like permease